MRRQTDEIVDLLRQFSMRADRWVDTRGQNMGVHRTHLNALGHLMEAERADQAMSPGELSAALRLSAPATTALVDRLVEAGHVERDRHPVDRRRTVLVVTDSARETGASIFAPLGRQLGAVSSTLDAAEREVVVRFLTDAIAAVDPDDV